MFPLLRFFSVTSLLMMIGATILLTYTPPTAGGIAGVLGGVYVVLWLIAWYVDRAIRSRDLELRHSLRDLAASREALDERLQESTRALDGATRRLEQEIQARRIKAAELEHQVLHDGLTGLPNRTLFRDRVHHAIITGRRDERSLAVVVMDVHRFREINTTLGHQHGDQLLKQLGRRFTEILRENDTIARLSGDEFGLLLPTAGERHRVAVVIEKFQRALETPFVIKGERLEISARLGVALCPEHGDSADTLLRRAHMAMAVAKREGRDVVIYAADQDRGSPRRFALMGELRYAIEHGEMLLHYQPKIDLRGGRVIGVEGLVRWQHPDRGMIPPGHFVPIAEQTGLIRPLTVWVLAAGLQQCHAWCEAGLQLSIAINLSASSLQDTHLPDQIAEQLTRSGVPPDRLEFEITESVIMADPVRAMAILTRLSAMGVKLSIDDFGTGYSSLGYLKKLPVDAIKIDRSFTSDMVINDDDAVIVRSTIDLAHNLGLQVVAEGVENRETWERLAALGCDAAQGYYMSPPILADALTRWFSESPWVVTKFVRPSDSKAA